MMATLSLRSTKPECTDQTLPTAKLIAPINVNAGRLGRYDYTKAYNTFNLTNTTSFAISYLNPLFNALRTPGELFTNVIGKAVNLLVGFRPPKYKSIASYKSLVEEDSYFTPKAPRLSETDIHNDKTDDPRDAYWSTDKAFGAQRVSGLNPTLINKVCVCPTCVTNLIVWA